MRKIALVTGASSGIGKFSAIALAANGFDVVLAGRREKELQEAAKEAGPHAVAIVADVTDEASVENLFSQTKKKFGRLDLLFNNAGSNVPATDISDLTLAQWRQVHDSIVTGTFLCTRAGFRMMKEQSPQGGRIINNGSISAYMPRPGSGPYTSAKHAVLGLTKTTSLDGRKYNIACGQIDVGNADTSMGGRMAHGVPQANGTIAAEPVMDVRHVADAVVNMAKLPLEANVLNMTIMATKMPFVGRG